MTHQFDLPVRLVVFASEQVFPTLQFLLHNADYWGDRLASIHIYCTLDQQRSLDPAGRLEKALVGWFEARKQGVDIEVLEGGMWPQDVRPNLLGWFEEYPSSFWVVNVTGGTKPMAAAAVELTLATDLAHRQIVYQEISGQWAEICADDDGMLRTKLVSAQTDRVVPAHDALDRLLPVRNLVAAQFSVEHTISLNTVSSVPLDAITTKLFENRWNWKHAFSALKQKCSGSGDAFERYIAAGLQACGLFVYHSLKVVDPVRQQTVRELDLVCCRGSRLVCIDIKLPGASEKQLGTQLADIAELTRALGGSRALPVAIRPGWKENEGVRRLADALRVQLLTSDQAPSVFSCIAHWIDPGLTIPPEIAALEQRLLSHYKLGHDVLSDGSVLHQRIDSHGTLQQEETWKKIMRRQQRDYLLMRQPPAGYLFALCHTNYVAGNELSHWMSRIALAERTIAPFASGEMRIRSSERWCTMEFEPPDNRLAQAELDYALKQALGPTQL